MTPLYIDVHLLVALPYLIVRQTLCGSLPDQLILIHPRTSIANNPVYPILGPIISLALFENSVQCFKFLLSKL